MRHLRRAAWLLVGLSLAIAVLAALGGVGGGGGGEHTAVAALLVVLTAPVIGRRVLRRPVVDSRWCPGPCASTSSWASPLLSCSPWWTWSRRGAFFTVAGEQEAVDFLYFSLVTLTTTGYGDLAARTDLGRMLAVTEALTGQVYLVTVVAVLVGNIGRVRAKGARRAERGEIPRRRQQRDGAAGGLPPRPRRSAPAPGGRTGALRPHRGDTVEVVFDGSPSEPSEGHSLDAPAGLREGGVRVTYAGRGADADTQIRELVGQAEAEHRPVVVTSDRRLAEDLHRLGAEVIRSGELRRRLDALPPEDVDAGDAAGPPAGTESRGEGVRSGMRGRRLIYRPGLRVDLEGFEVPAPGPGQLLLAVTRSQVSAGSELNALRAISTAGADVPGRQMGFTTVGRVQALGSGGRWAGRAGVEGGA